jgi:hypothetical protein
MSISFIASKGPLKLFSLGNYQYQICRLTNGQIKIIKNLYGYDFDNAIATFNSMA